MEGWHVVAAQTASREKLSFALGDGLPQQRTPSDRMDGRWGVTA
jgi:hypothetical protein